MHMETELKDTLETVLNHDTIYLWIEERLDFGWDLIVSYKIWEAEHEGEYVRFGPFMDSATANGVLSVVQVLLEKMGKNLSCE